MNEREGETNYVKSGSFKYLLVFVAVFPLKCMLNTKTKKREKEKTGRNKRFSFFFMKAIYYSYTFVVNV